MEYIRKDGKKVIVDGDKVKYEELNMQKNIIGANFIHGIISGGYLSSFNGSFTDELIGIQSGLVDIVNAKIGNIKDAYELFRLKISNIDNLTIKKKSYVAPRTIYFKCGKITKRMTIQLMWGRLIEK